MSGQLSPQFLGGSRPRPLRSCARLPPSFASPVLLYSIGKDSVMMPHVALKAFFPAKPTFPLLHVDTTWKFRDTIAFRDQRAKATPRKSSDQLKDKCALYYRAARHVLERHNSGARPTR
jgi:3'-phosphoadenosine 5'-phosphosulfate sulfotransferase (PAPS reductase)/FAD synthetase